MSKTTILALVFGLAVLALLVSSTLDLRRYSCEVCVTFNGRTNCAKASGTSREEAQRSAQDTACATISGGMTETIQCSNRNPDSVEWF